MYKMKKKILIIILAPIFFASCKKNFIDIQPITSVDVRAVYKTDNDYKAAVLGGYRALADQYQNFWQFADLRADDGEAQAYKGNEFDFVNDFTLDNSSGLLNNSWRNYYLIISRANTVLQNIEGAKIEVVKNKDTYIGEVKLLRALAYFDLVRIFGDVPAIKSVITEEESYTIKRTPVETIYKDIILPDLLEAEAKLPKTYATAEIGRATSGAAKSILGRVYLTRKDFANAEAKLKEVTLIGSSLLPNYKDLFDYSKNEHHSEFIFDIEYEEILGSCNGNTHNFLPRNPALLTSYNVVGQGGDSNGPSKELISLFTSDDKRKAVTVATGFTNAQGVYISIANDIVYSYTNKYTTPTSIQGNSKANWKLIRYADVLLMYAEALNENGKTSEALFLLNMVRTRAGVASRIALNKDDTREKIYTERRLELSFEGHRWFDLIRTGRALQVLASLGMKVHMTLFPVPLAQIQVINNNKVLPQNPGYQ